MTTITRQLCDFCQVNPATTMSPTGHGFCEPCRAATPPLKVGSDVLDQTFQFLAQFVAYPSPHAHLAHALWILHTHLMECWESTPRIAFLSPEPGSGKTRALEVTELLVPNPVEAVNVTPAYMFRKVGDDGAKPTILFDEIDTVFGPKARENEEIRGLLNAGHRKGAVAGRCVVKGNAVVTEEIPAYCAVALAGIGDLPDTLLSRSVIVRMRRRAPSETVEPYRRRVHSPQGELLRSALQTWADGVRDELGGAYPVMPEGITDRDADVWEPLLAVADQIGGEWSERARVAAVALVADSKVDTPSLGIRLLADLRAVFRESDHLPTEEILEGLCGLDEAPWGDLYGKPITPRGLAQRLRPYGVKSANVRAGDTVVKGYARASLWDAWERYLPKLESSSYESATSATSATPEEPVTDPYAEAERIVRVGLDPDAAAVDPCTHCGQVPPNGEECFSPTGESRCAEHCADEPARETV